MSWEAIVEIAGATAVVVTLVLLLVQLLERTKTLESVNQALLTGSLFPKNTIMLKLRNQGRHSS